MTALDPHLWFLIFYGIFRVFVLVRILWNAPLQHGPGFFLGAEVAPGFYDGPGVQWLRRFRAVTIAEHLAEVVIFAVFVLHRWLEYAFLPIYGLIVIYVLFIVWLRRHAGVAPRKLPAVAIPLDARRLADYVSWPTEAVLAVIVAASWLLLLTRAGRLADWGLAVVMTYVFLGLLHLKIAIARSSFPPLPSERTEEYQRWLEADRRYVLRLIESMRWFLAVMLGLHTTMEQVPRPAWTAVWLPWLVSYSGAVYLLVIVIIIFRGKTRLASMGRDLRPPGSWSGPFDSPRIMQRGPVNCFVAYCAGLAVLLAFFYLPLWWQPALDVQAGFEGQRVQFAYPRSEAVQFDLELNMDKGLCDILRITSSGRSEEFGSMDKGTIRARLGAGDSLQLAPRPGAAGRYHVRLGPPHGLCTLLSGGPLSILGGARRREVAAIPQGDSQ